MARTNATDTLIKRAAEIISTEVTHHIQHTPAHTVTTEQAQQIAETAKQKLSEDKDLGDVFRENEMSLAAWLLQKTEETHRAAQAKFIPIIRIKVTDAGVEDKINDPDVIAKKNRGIQYCKLTTNWSKRMDTSCGGICSSRPSR